MRTKLQWFVLGAISMGAAFAFGALLFYAAAVAITVQLVPTRTPFPSTYTPWPTYTPTRVSTATPMPTATPTLLTIGYIERQRMELAGPRWESYSQYLVGEEITFAGEVVDVFVDGVLVAVLLADVTRTELLTMCFLGGIPPDIAFSLAEGEFLRGEGTVEAVIVHEGDLAVWIRVVQLDGYLDVEGRAARVR